MVRSFALTLATNEITCERGGHCRWTDYVDYLCIDGVVIAWQIEVLYPRDSEVSPVPSLLKNAKTNMKVVSRVRREKIKAMITVARKPPSASTVLPMFLAPQRHIPN